MPRLLVCNSCGTMHKMRDYDGNADNDMELQEIIKMHLGRAQNQSPDAHMSQIFRCDQATYDALDGETGIKKELMKNEIEVREIRDDLKVEALKCFQRHGAPKGSCIDWEDESKTIGRKVGVPKEQWQYLCHFCPVGSGYVATKERTALGMYD